MKALLRGLIFGMVSVLLGSTTSARELTLEQRIAAQRAIEQVYWSHRTWPKENAKPKPSLDEAMPESVLRAKVEDYLKKSNALERHWGRPITADQLEAEMDRMASNTKAPEVLQEIFEALGEDRFVIAETLARQTLADRLIRNWYAWDDRFNGAVKRRAQRSLARLRSTNDMRSLGGRYAETTWKLGPNASEGPEPGDKQGPVRLGAKDWRNLMNRLTGRLGHARGGGSEAVPARLVGLKPSDLEEGRDAFHATAVLATEGDAVTTATVTWPKGSFESWWNSARNSMSLAVEPSPTLSGRAVVRAKKCQDDTWTAVPTEVPEPRHTHTAVWTGKEMIVWGGIGGEIFDTGGRYNPSTDTWVPISTTMAPTRRYLHTAVWTGTEMIVWGGIGPGEALGTGGRYDPETDTWSATSMDGAPTGRHGHTAVWTGTEMIIWGGDRHPWRPWPDTNEGPYLALQTGGRYDPASDTWTATSSLSVPSARSHHTAVWTGREMIVWGGCGQDPTTKSLDTGGRYSPETDTWIPTSTFGVPTARCWHSAVWTGQEMIVFGVFMGHDEASTEPGPPDTGGRYDPATDTWRSTNPVITPDGFPRLATGDRQAAVWTGNEMIVWGGLGVDGDGKLMSLWGGLRYRPDTDTWSDVNPRGAPDIRDGHTAVWTGTEMIVWGGRYVSDSQVFLYRNTGYRYSPASDIWMRTHTGTAPSARKDHTAVWTGSEMIVWGGWGDALLPWWHYDLNTGGRFTPATDSWAPTTTLGTPSARRQHTAVWTGSEMIVWGGGPSGNDDEGIFGPRRTGGRYDPATDTWAATSTKGAPSERYLHTAVWTGREMIVWGGSSSGGPCELLDGIPCLTTGGRYDPDTDTWRPTSEDGAPSARALYTAVWASSEMIVWGGLSGSDCRPSYHSCAVNTGARYDPTADTWKPTATGSAPVGRYSHSAVWTGREMIVWGGAESAPSGASCGPFGSYCLDTGGRYDPREDTWIPTTVTNPPIARKRHTAVWTGREMIVWGGIPTYQASEAGGRYDPAADGWTSMSTESEPYGRMFHTASWTGREMIVWGGGRPGSEYYSCSDSWCGPLASGGRYCARGNSPPIASAGSDQALECDGDLRAVARLDGSGSSDPDSTPGTNDDIERFDWSEGGVKLGSGAQISEPLVLGPHRVALSVTDTVGESDKDEALFTVQDGLPPAGNITAPLEGECYGPPRLPVILEDDFSDLCDPSLGRTYDPSPGPSYGDHGDHAVTLAVRDSSGNEARAAVDFTVDTHAPTVEILSPPDRKALAPSALPLSLLFRSSDDDGASGGVLREVVKLQGCTIYDGLSYGDGDGLLSDESVSLTRGELCRVSVLCGFARLDQPELRVEATDCGGNVGFASHRFQGSLLLSPGACGR